jgi:CDP-diacylglycerol--glycerol-3-phosphate 3-phosphatidyltransferase
MAGSHEVSMDASGAVKPAREAEIFWNLPNSITMLRIGVVPVLLAIPFATSKWACSVIAWCFIVAAASDVADGYIARRGGLVTRIGKLLDPLADKLLVSAALIMLVAAGRMEWWGAWMVVVIVGRELAVTGLRSIASSEGEVMAAAWHGKVKAVVQNLAIAALIFHYETFGLPAHEIGLAFLAVATVLTLWSGYVYFVNYFSAGPAPEPGGPEA